METRKGLEWVGSPTKASEMIIQTVQQIVRMGKAKEYFKLKDRITCYHEEFGLLTWEIIGIDKDTPVDTKFPHSLTLAMVQALPTDKAFDAGGTNYEYGYNSWEHSDIRQWLNSREPADKWWKADSAVAGDKPPRYSNQNGFLYGLDPAFLSAIGPVKKTTAKNSADGGSSVVTKDRVFLLSYTELGFGNNSGIAEGSRYGVFTDAASRIKTAMGGTGPVYWWMRSPYVSNSNIVYIVYNSGSSYDNYAYYSYYVVPACVIY